MPSLKNFFRGSPEVQEARQRISDLKRLQERAAHNPKKEKENELFFLERARAPDRKLVNRHLMKVSAAVFAAIFALIGGSIELAQYISKNKKNYTFTIRDNLGNNQPHPNSSDLSITTPLDSHDMVQAISKNYRENIKLISEATVNHIEIIMIKLMEKLIQNAKAIPEYENRISEIIAPLELVKANQHNPNKFFYSLIDDTTKPEEINAEYIDAKAARIAEIAKKTPFFYAIADNPEADVGYVPGQSTLFIPQYLLPDNSGLDYDDMDTLIIYYHLATIAHDLAEREKWRDENKDINDYNERFKGQTGALTDQKIEQEWHTYAAGLMMEVLNILLNNHLYEAALNHEELDINKFSESDFKFRNRKNKGRFVRAISLFDSYFPHRLDNDEKRQAFFQNLTDVFIHLP